MDIKTAMISIAITDREAAYSKVNEILHMNAALLIRSDIFFLRDAL
jgi:hypothetical protein